MKKITVFDLFLVFAIVLTIGTKSILSSIILLCAAALELIDVIPKLVRILKGERHGGE